MKILGRGWQEGDPVPLVGWLLIGALSTLFALVAGAFVSLAFYYFHGVFASLLHFVYPDWVPYAGDIAWTLGFCTGVFMSVFSKTRWKRRTVRKKAVSRTGPVKESSPPSPPVASLETVVKRTLLGGGVGLVVGLFLALLLEMLFFSASLSPIGPPTWKAAVSTKYRRERRTMNERERTSMEMSSTHPLFKYLFMVPVSVTPVVGATVGGGTALRSWLRR